MNLSISVIFLLLTSKLYVGAVSPKRRERNQSFDMPCILVTLGARLNITYPTKYGTSQTVQDFDLPINGKRYESSCKRDDPYQEISIEWMDKNLFNTMNLTFYSNHETKQFTLGAIVFQLAVEIFPNGSFDWLELFYFGNSLAAPFGNSYQCGRIKSLPLRLKNQKNIVGTVELSNIQFEAYRTKDNEEFSTPVNCRVNEEPDTRSKWYENKSPKETPTAGMETNEKELPNNSTRDIVIISISVVVTIALAAIVYIIYDRRSKSTNATKIYLQYIHRR